MSCVFMIIIFQDFICAHMQLITFTLWSISNLFVHCQYTWKFTFSVVHVHVIGFFLLIVGKGDGWLQWENSFGFCHITMFPREISGNMYELGVESKWFVSKVPKSTGLVWYMVWGSAAVFILSDLVPQQYSQSQVLLSLCWHKDK